MHKHFETGEYTVIRSLMTPANWDRAMQRNDSFETARTLWEAALRHVAQERKMDPSYLAERWLHSTGNFVPHATDEQIERLNTIAQG